MTSLQKYFFGKVIVPTGGRARVVVTPEKVIATCRRNPAVRPPVRFNPSDNKSVARAKRAARWHLPIVVSRVCDFCGLDCGLRRLDDDGINNLMGTF